MEVEQYRTWELPSGKIYGEADMKLLKRLHELGTIAWSDTPFKLKSGIDSHVYVHAREELTQNIEALTQIGQMILQAIYRDRYREKDMRTPCIIGIPTAGTPLAAATAMVARDHDIAFKMMREKKKEHGADRRWTDGTVDTDTYRYCTVENVITSGASIMEAKERLAEDGYPIAEMVDYILVDRRQGGVKRLQELNYSVRPLFYLGDIAYAFSCLGLWNDDQVKKVEDEIRKHQFR